ncbi:hypothetical protein [Martelella lutilitoris]|uniref:hypothetical protein n=1 Tax=Martelella lutilitoris TaxID=2583532 RepID=UPI0016512FA7|nr:hypothetical protein [Martelella lutilitoris]
MAGAIAAKLCNAGQSCVCVNRIYDRFAERLSEAVVTLKAAHKLKRAVFFHEQDEIRDRAFDRQAFLASGLNLVLLGNYAGDHENEVVKRISVLGLPTNRSGFYMGEARLQSPTR